MKNRTSLLLMEQLIMVLVFALAAALCLNVFVEADRISRATASRDEGVLIAQNAAEVLKATSGDTAQTEQIVYAHAAGGYRMEIEKLDSEVPLLGEAEIRIYLKNDLIFTLNTGWQEEEK